MPFSGIPTFIKVPLVEDPNSLARGSIGVIGVPYDEGTTNRPGARFGPRAVREASMLYSYWEGGNALDRGRGLRGFFDIESGETILTDVSIADLGDVPVLPTSVTETHNRISDSVRSLLEAGVFPVVLGGDHSISYPVIKGLDRDGEKIWILQLDSHLDYLADFDGTKHTHASQMRLIRGLDCVEGIFHAGVRGILGDEDILEKVKSDGGAVVTTEEILKGDIEGMLSNMPDLEKCYVTIDIDVFDPSIAPGTGVPEPGGLGFRDIRSILRGVARRYEVVGFDIVEVNPLYDNSETTAILAARTVIDFLGVIYSRKVRK
jgi:agmatinase